MNDDAVTTIARALLYEGYLLYPYRPSVKNHQRWTFGAVVPETYAAAARAGDAHTMQTQCIARVQDAPAVDVKIRFLHLVNRIVGRFPTSLARWPDHGEPQYDVVESLDVDDQRISAWQEAEEREVALPRMPLRDLSQRPLRVAISFPATSRTEPIRNQQGAYTGLLLRQQKALNGTVELSAHLSADATWTITVKIANHSIIPDPHHKSRDNAMLFSFVSTHTILTIAGGTFISMADPPPPQRDLAATSVNQGTWPVLTGVEGQQDTLLSSPIILSDYPQIAPQSPGDLFDASEIDEILSLRIMTLTDDEKRDVAATDPRGRALLQRTEALARDQLMSLHGVMHPTRPATKGTP